MFHSGKNFSKEEESIASDSNYLPNKIFNVH